MGDRRASTSRPIAADASPRSCWPDRTSSSAWPVSTCARPWSCDPSSTPGRSRSRSSCAGAASSVPATAGQSIDVWLRAAHEGRTPVQLMGSSDVDDVADPVGRGPAVYEATARELGRPRRPAGRPTLAAGRVGLLGLIDDQPDRRPDTRAGDANDEPEPRSLPMPWPTERDTELFDLIDQEVERQNTTLQLIASENFTSPAVMEATGLGADQQVRRGLPGQALLRRQRLHRRGRGPRPRAGQGPVRRRARQRAAPLGGQRQRGGLPGPARAGRQGHGHEPRPRRPPHPRLAGQHQRPALRLRLLRRHAERRAPRLRPDPRPGPSRAPEADRRRGHRLPPHHRAGAVCARSPTRSARCSCSTPPTSPGSSPVACTRTRCPTPTSSPSPPTRRCAARGAAAS